MNRTLKLAILLAAFALLVLFALIVGSSPAKATPWICPTAFVNDTTTVLYWHTFPKPAVGAAFVDSQYSTCFQRITTDTNTGDANGPTPIYSQLQAWNSDQTMIMFNNGLLLASPSYATIGSTTLPGNFRWSPIYPDTGYYSAQNGGTTKIPTFMAYNVLTHGTRIVRAFPEYRKLQVANEWEDVDSSGRFVVLQGYTHGSPKGTMPIGDGTDADTMQIRCGLLSGVTTFLPTDGNGQTDSLEVGCDVSGPGLLRGTRITAINRGTKVITINQAPTISTPLATVTFSNSEAFVLNVQTGWKGRAIPTWNTIGTGVPDMLMAPKGNFMLLHWGSGCTDSLTCGVIAYDTTGAYAGKVVGSASHYDLTIDKDGKQYWVGSLISADTPPPRAALARALIPNGWNINNACRNNNVVDNTGIVDLCPMPSFGAGGGIHVSGRAFGAGFVVVSADKDYDTRRARVVFDNELVKVYLDSRRNGSGTLNIERLADTRTDPYSPKTGPFHLTTCGISYYWAAPHATISRDGTRVLWGSIWDDSVSCPGESYVMDISRQPRNVNFVNQPSNTWRRLTPPKVIKYDGTGGGAADTLAPYRTYSGHVFAPELGALLSFGGGADGASQGLANDVWTFTPYDTTWRQTTFPDSLNKYPRSVADAGGGDYRQIVNGPYSMRDFMRLPGGMHGSLGDSIFWRQTYPTTAEGGIWLPPGRTRNGVPWSSHIYDQLVWDSWQRKLKLFGANFNYTTPPPDSICPGESTFVINCTWTAGSPTLTSAALFGAIPKTGAGFPSSPRSQGGLMVKAPGLGCDTTFTVVTLNSSSSITMDRNANSTASTPQPVTFGYQVPWQSYGYFATRGSWSYDPYKKTWAYIDSLPDLYHQNGSGEYDPITHKWVALSWDVWHTASGSSWGGPNGLRTWTMDSTQAWSRLASAAPPFDSYGVTANYDRRNQKIIWYPSHNGTAMWEFDPKTSAYNQLTPTADPVNGSPASGDANTAYDSKNSRLLVFGWNANFGAWNPTWIYDVASNQWTKKLPTGEPVIGSGTSDPRDRGVTISYDPTDNIYVMVRKNGQNNVAGNGQPVVTATPLAEVWTYKDSSGDGRLFAPTTYPFSLTGGGSGGSGTCITPGF